MSRRPLTEARARRESPFLDEHARSQRDRAAEPHHFAGRLAWFLEGFWAETPERVHTAGVWFGRPPRLDSHGDPVEDVPAELVGGSQIGSPKLAEPFRQLLENSPRQTAGDVDDEHYVRPMRAALARLGSLRDGDGAFMARFLLQIAYAQGDWRSVADRWFAVTPWVGRAFAEHALRRLQSCYRAEPPVRYLPPRVIAAAVGPTWVDKSESQRAAEEAAERGVA